MDVISLHPLNLEIVSHYVAVLHGTPPEPADAGWFTERLRDDARLAGTGNEGAANRVTLGLARALSMSGPVFIQGVSGLSFWEAQVDRPIGMLMRPPSRLFADHGLDAAAGRAMPVRLDAQLGMMGGAWMPARLVGQAYEQLDDHLERSVKRLVAAEYDPLPVAGLLQEALAYALANGVGLYEAQNLCGPNGEGLPGATIVRPDPARLDPDLVTRIEASQQPPRKPGLLQRMFGRGGSGPSANGTHPE